jgi:hypothetical protein
MTPTYLSSLVPSLVSCASNYNLRNADNLQIPLSRTQLYSNSFLPSAVRLWNSIPSETRNSGSVSSFKYSLNSNKRKKPPLYYYTGNRVDQIAHTRLRTNCSSLNLTLFQKNILESPLCECGEIESTEHFFLLCRNYCEARRSLLESVHPICSTKILLYGDNSLSSDQNILIFEAVHKYIKTTKRFS